MADAEHLNDDRTGLLCWRILIRNPAQRHEALRDIVGEANEVEAVVQIKALRLGVEVNLVESAGTGV